MISRAMTAIPQLPLLGRLERHSGTGRPGDPHPSRFSMFNGVFRKTTIGNRFGKIKGSDPLGRPILLPAVPLDFPNREDRRAPVEAR
jgi:hypothetical protein